MDRNILIAVDDHVMRLGLVGLLKERNHWKTAIEEAGAVEKAVSVLDAGQRHVTFLRFGDADIDQVLESVRRNNGVAILIDPVCPINLQQLLKLGVRGFLFSPIMPDTLAMAIATVAEGDLYIGPLNQEKAVSQAVLEPQPQDTVSGLADQLTERETEIVTRVSQGCTNKQIAETLFLSLSTVKSHLRRIMAKFKVRDRVGIVTQVNQRTPATFAVASESLNAPNP